MIGATGWREIMAGTAMVGITMVAMVVMAWMDTMRVVR